MDGKASKGSIFGDIFPSKLSAAIFVAYITLYVNQGVLITATKTGDKYNYNTVVVVLLTECIKLVIAIGIYAKDEPICNLYAQFTSHLKVFLLYFVPAALYCLYNNLAFISLASFDPTTYYLLLQFRVVVTAVIYQLVFKKQLSAWQWFSLLLLTLGCLVKNLGRMTDQSGNVSFEHVVNVKLLLILVQVFCSCFAGVYNEYLLKGSSANVHIMIQNMYMYIDSIICNVLVLAFANGAGSEPGSLSSESFMAALLEPSVFFVMLNNALCGIVTSVFLKNLNSILKTFASAIELAFTAVVCWILFSHAIDLYTIVSIAIVFYSTYLYSQHPVISRPSTTPVTYSPIPQVDEDRHKVRVSAV